MKSIVRSMVVLLAWWPAIGLGQFGDGFASSDPATYLANAAGLYQDAAIVDAPGLSSTRALRLRYENEQYAQFHRVAVTPGEVVTVNFRARWNNDQTLETNPTFALAIGQTWEIGVRALPTMAIDFFDDQQNLLPAKLFTVMPHGRWQSYHHRFLVPAGAATMQLRIKCGSLGGELFIADLRMDRQPGDAGPLVLNFVVGDADARGSIFGYALDDSAQDTPQGRLVHSGYGGASNPLPLAEPGEYRIRIDALAQEDGYHSLAIAFLDAAGKNVGNMKINEAAAGPVSFTRPDGATSAQLVIHNHWLREVRLERVR